MSNFTAIYAKFWATLVENPWTIVVQSKPLRVRKSCP